MTGRWFEQGGPLLNFPVGYALALEEFVSEPPDTIKMPKLPEGIDPRAVLTAMLMDVVGPRDWRDYEDCGAWTSTPPPETEG